MSLNNNVLIAGVIGFILGSAVTYAVISNKQAVPAQQLTKSSHRMPDGKMMKNGSMDMDDDSMSMQGMVETLKGKKGDEFDEEFIEQMIPHHQGAIDMAKLAQQYAKHYELKNLANDIIEAQTKEINMMKEWSKSWGYNK